MFTVAQSAPQGSPQAAGLSGPARRAVVPPVVRACLLAVLVLCLPPSLSFAESPNIRAKAGVSGQADFTGGGWALIHPAMYRSMSVAGPDWPDRPDRKEAAAGLGPNGTLGFPMVRCRLGQDVTLRAGARVDLGERSYRLAEGSHVYPKGAISTTGVTAGAYVDISPVQGLTATLGLEYDMERKYEIRSNGGNKKQTIRVENTPTLQFSLGYRF